MKWTIMGHYRQLAREWMLENPTGNLTAYLYGVIDFQDACRQREQVIKQRKLKRQAKTLSEKILLGKAYIVRTLVRELKTKTDAKAVHPT